MDWSLAYMFEYWDRRKQLAEGLHNQQYQVGDNRIEQRHGMPFCERSEDPNLASFWGGKTLITMTEHYGKKRLPVMTNANR